MELTAEFIETKWPLTDVNIGDVLQKSGERIVGIIDSKQGRFVFKIADPWKTEKAIIRDLTAFDYLREYGFKYISTILKTKQNQDYGTKEGQFIYLMPFIEGQHPVDSPETYSKLGGIMGELHNVQGFPFETEFKAVTVIKDLKINSANYSFGTEYLKLVENLPDFESLPKSLIHTDISPVNTIQDMEDRFVLIDWDDVGIGTRILDLGYPLGHFISEDLEFFEDNARAFYKAYFNQVKLTDEEVSSIVDAGIFFGLMYIIYGDLNKRWARIKWTVSNRERLENLIREAAGS